MIKWFYTVFKDGDHDGKNFICSSKEACMKRIEELKTKLHPGDSICINYGDFDEKDGHLKGGSFYYVDGWDIK